MFRSRFWMLVVIVGLMLGCLVGTAGYGLYLRSNLYADRLAERVSSFLGAPVQIGSSTPIDATSQAFGDVVVWLPGEFYPIFYCKRAAVRLTGEQTMDLDVRDGQILAETDTWNEETLASLVRTAFAHDFGQVRMASVNLAGMDITVRRGPITLHTRNATGRIDLSSDGGRIDLLCEGLNDQQAGDPVAIRCRFQPGSPPRIDELSLSVRRLPAQAFVRPRNSPRGTSAGVKGLEDASEGEPVAAGDGSPDMGWLSGTLTYRQTNGDILAGAVEFTGELDGLDLGAVGVRTGKSHLSGKVSGTINKAIFSGGELRSVQGRAHLEGLPVASLLGSASNWTGGGVVDLDVHELRYEDHQVKAMLATGRVSSLDLSPVLRDWCGGGMSGELSLEAQKIKVIEGRLDEVAGLIRVTPPEGTPGTIGRLVLETAIRHLLHIELPPVLPEEIGYSELGARLHGADNELYVEGIAGPEDKYLLMADFAAQPIPLIAQPADPLSMEPLQALLAEKTLAVQGLLRTWVDEKILRPR